MKKDKIEKLFNQYEKAFDKLDMRAIAELYGENVVTAGPRGTILSGKKEYEEKSEEAANFYRSVGHKSAHIVSKKFTRISDHYTLVDVRWGVSFKTTGDKPFEFDVSYIIQDTPGLDDPQIVMFITHTDEEEAMKKLGLLKEQVLANH